MLSNVVVWWYFNPRAPCGARQNMLHKHYKDFSISIHAPRVGRDCETTPWSRARTRFQSTRPVWGATRFNPLDGRGVKFQSTRPVWGATSEARRLSLYYPISIHAPRVGRDQRSSTWNSRQIISIHAPRVGRDQYPAFHRQRQRDFNPRAPCGARRRHTSTSDAGRTFQSTRPVWGATMKVV